MTPPRTVLITGSSRGIGLLTAKALATRGHKVYASMRSLNTNNQVIADNLRHWAKTSGTDLVPIELDVADDASVREAVQEIESKDKLDALINNAGIMPTGLTEGYTLDQVKKCFDVNMFGIVRTTRAVLPHMRARNSGLLVHLSSVAGRFAMPFFGVYCASKWAMEAYCETLHYELEAYDIESVLIEPSGHGTDLVKTSMPPRDDASLAMYGDFAHGRERLLGMFQSMFDQGDVSTDANNVATSIIQLIESDRPRPIRTAVGHDMGVAALNGAIAPIQADLIQELKPVYAPSSS